MGCIIEWGSREHISGLTREALEDEFTWLLGKYRELESECIRLSKELHRNPVTRKYADHFAASGYRRCSRCGKIKQISEFNPKKDRKSGLSSWCRDCSLEACRESKRKIRAIESDRRMLHRTHAELIDEGERRTAAIIGNGGKGRNGRASH